MHKFTLVFFSLAFSASTLAADIFKADRLYTSQQYEQAKQEYLAGAKIGNPHAYYQLATMYSKGLGEQKDPLNALIYFSLAAEYDFHNAKELVNKMLNATPENQRKELQRILVDFQQRHGKAKINQALFPVIVQEKLPLKVTFEGEPALESMYKEDIASDDLATDYIENLDEDDELSLMMSTPLKPVLILEHDVNPDGSIRYYSEVQKIGAPLNLIKNYILFPTKKPEFDKQPAHFIHRSYLGAATYNKFTLLEEDPALYKKIVLLRAKLEKGTSIQEQYQYAMLLLNFPWIKQEDNEAEQRLYGLAKQGHPLAMYEYGIKLYLEQSKITEAIHWISQASKYGLSRAEYRLGKLLQTSPWVEHDDKKALFWYNLAIDKDHIAAKLRATEILLTSKNKALHDLNQAIEYLNALADSESNNPEYYYLLALSHQQRENRDFTQVVDNLRTAIEKGNRANWDVSDWQDLLSRLTTGSVYISDQ
ncbi:tetratricopeptide repeat protein [Thalassotalea sp. PLHSN55]|uniref:tetratricopeptide repeat protein n=1 Tax=Thalassotalea sp. PLHSN55 TaxID=3435888 RepID=UPI003F85F58C